MFPGPGKYEITNFLCKTEAHYSIRPKGPKEYDAKVPGPGAYNVTDYNDITERPGSKIGN